VTQGRWGLVVQREGGKLPVFQKFQIGGISTVRGFRYREISPRDPVTGDRIGGEKMMVYNVEYRFPVVEKQGVLGVVFFDAGNVLREEEPWTFRGIRKSAGAGIRWYSPMGPLRLEYGRNLDPLPGEKKGRWEFTVSGDF
jgi:outer membrane protein insertion porin family